MSTGALAAIVALAVAGVILWAVAEVVIAVARSKLEGGE